MFRRITLALVVLAGGIFTVLPSTASAAVAPAPLTGEQLAACGGSSLSGSSFTCANFPSGTDVHIKVNCNDNGTGRITWRANGIATGPYPGTFTESGSVTFTNPGIFSGIATNVSVSFHIDSPLGDVDGRKFLSQYQLAGITCASHPSQPNITAVQVNGSVRYEAIIKPLTGGAYADEGFSALLLQSEVPTNLAGTEQEYNAGIFNEQFYSDAAQTTPLLPSAKRQCRDRGFAVFGVFENQGDCVSFVSTYGRNEPGRTRS